MKAIISEDAVVAGEGLKNLLEARLPKQIDDDYFSQDWNSIWVELVTGGWIFSRSQDDGGALDEFPSCTLDLCALGEIWGRFLVPLPYVPTLALAWYGQLDVGVLSDPTSCAVSIPESKNVLVPFWNSTVRVCQSGRSSIMKSDLGTIQSIDDFAASVPFATVAPGDPLTGSPKFDALFASLIASEMIGAAAATLDKSVDYANVRAQFGHKISSYQAVAHRLANMHCQLEMARSALAWNCGDDSKDAQSSLRAVANCCLRVAEDAVQVHGGIGFTWEAAPHRYLRHVLGLNRLLGILLAGHDHGS